MQSERLQKRWKVQTLLQSHPSRFWEQFLARNLAKNMPGRSKIQHGACQQHSHATGALRLPSYSNQCKQQAGLLPLKIKSFPVLPASICTANG